MLAPQRASQYCDGEPLTVGVLCAFHLQELGFQKPSSAMPRPGGDEHADRRLAEVVPEVVPAAPAPGPATSSFEVGPLHPSRMHPGCMVQPMPTGVPGMPALPQCV